jgi:hypothetical protein
VGKAKGELRKMPPKKQLTEFEKGKLAAEQEGVERFLREKAVARVPRLKLALAQREADLERDPTNEKANDWRILCEDYRRDLEIIAGGSYPGYNGKPFGAWPGKN